MNGRIKVRIKRIPNKYVDSLVRLSLNEGKYIRYKAKKKGRY